MQAYARRIVPANPAFVFGSLSIGLSLLTAVVIARSSTLFSLPIAAVLGLAGAIVLLSLRPETVFISWFALAPFLQESANYTALGHLAALALYVAPPLVFALWTMTRPARIAPAGFVDALPFAFFLFVLGSLVLTADPSGTLIKAVYTTIGIGVCLYYFFAFGPIGLLTRERVIGVLLALCLIEAGMSIVDGVVGWNLWDDDGWQFDGERRAVATLALPAGLGVFIGMGIAFALSLLVWRGPTRLRKLAIATVVVGLPGMFFTYTRAPILATVIVGVIILATRPHTRVLAVVSLIFAAGVIAGSWSQITNSAIYSSRVSNSSNIEVRTAIQERSLSLAAERPFFGHGYGSFDRVKNLGDLSSENLSAETVSSTTSHNTYLTILVQYGGIALALLLIPWLTIGWRALGDGFRNPDVRWFVSGALGALAIYVLTANANDFRFFSFIPALPWLLLGMLRRRQLEQQG